MNLMTKKSSPKGADVSRRTAIAGAISLTLVLPGQPARAFPVAAIPLVLRLIGLLISARRLVVIARAGGTPQVIVAASLEEVQRQATALGIDLLTAVVLTVLAGDVVMEMKDAVRGDVEINNKSSNRYNTLSLYSVIRAETKNGRAGKIIGRRFVTNIDNVEAKTPLSFSGLNLADPLEVGSYFVNLELLDDNKVVAKTKPARFHTASPQVLSKLRTT